MLFESQDVAGYTRRKGQRQDPERWCYNSGSTNLITEMLRNSFQSIEDYFRFP